MEPRCNPREPGVACPEGHAFPPKGKSLDYYNNQCIGLRPKLRGEASMQPQGTRGSFPRRGCISPEGGKASKKACRACIRRQAGSRGVNRPGCIPPHRAQGKLAGGENCFSWLIF